MLQPSALAEDVDDVLLLVQCQCAVNDPSWDHMISLITRKPNRKVLLVSSNNAPSAKQRARFIEALREHDARIAVLCSWSIIRGAIRATQWVSRINIQGFHIDAFDEALVYLAARVDPDRLKRRAASLAKISNDRAVSS